MSQVSDREQQEAVNRLWRRLQDIDRLNAHERPRTRNLFHAGSALADDDSMSKPFRLSHTVGHAMALSLDSMIGMRLLLEDPAQPGRLRLLMAAPYSMLRTAIEAGALGAWILQPEDGVERIRRSLRSSWSDIQNDNRLRKVSRSPILRIRRPRCSGSSGCFARITR